MIVLKLLKVFGNFAGLLVLSFGVLASAQALSIRAPQDIGEVVGAAGANGVLIQSNGQGSAVLEDRHGMRVVKCTLTGEVITGNDRAAAGDKQYVFYMVSNIKGLTCPAGFKGFVAVRGDSSLGLSSPVLGGEIPLQEEAGQAYATSALLKVSNATLSTRLSARSPQSAKALQRPSQRMSAQEVAEALRLLKAEIYGTPAQ